MVLWWDDIRSEEERERERETDFEVEFFGTCER